MSSRCVGDISVYREIVLDPQACDGETESENDVRQAFGDSQRPLEVDIGSGKGRFLLARASAHPSVNFLGIERQYGRVCKTAKKVRRAELKNVRLARMEAFEGIGKLLTSESVSVFYIFYPDPWPKRRHHRRRLVNPQFMDVLHNRLIHGGVIHFASDHVDYAKVVAGIFRADRRFEEIPPLIPNEDERTDFELLFAAMGKAANRISVRKLSE